MFSIYLQEATITQEQTITGALIIIAILLVSYLVTKYTKYGGGGNWGGNSDIDGDSFDSFD